MAPTDFTRVARLLADASVLVRTRGERGEGPSRDHRPRIREALARAADLAGTATGDRVPPPVRDWAVHLAAMEINAALGRGRNRDRGNLRESMRTLAGYGLDIGTLGAVNSAADLLTQAARTAEQIAAAIRLPVRGVGEVAVYQIGPVLAAAIDVGDLIELNDAALHADTRPVHGRVRAISVQPDGRRTFHLDPGAPGLTADELALTAQRCHTVWRPVPDLTHT